ncbi:MAG: zf-HC2 domain-containing protein [Ktedonobacterales bacterium]
MTHENPQPIACAACRTHLLHYVADQLTSPERLTVERHLAGCAACRAELAQWQFVAAALRDADAPLPPDTTAARDWARLRARLPETPSARPSLQRTPAALRLEREPIFMRQPPTQTETSSGVPRHRRTFSPVRSLIGGITAVAVVALIVLGFARILQFQAQKPHTGSTSRTVTASAPTAIPASAPRIGAPINWQAGVLPAGTTGNPTESVLTYAVSAQDSNTAYLCYGQSSPTHAPLSIWVTHDRALHWTLVSQLPGVGSVSDCALQVDTGDSQRVTATVMGQDITTPASIDRTYLSDDGGAHWTKLPDAVGGLGGLTTADSASFADLLSSDATLATAPPHLVVSHDNFQTWRPIDQALATHGQVSRFWVSPDGSDVLALLYAIPPPTTPTTLPRPLPTFAGLWETDDTGAHWSPIVPPATHVSQLFFAVQAPVAGQPWHICAWGYNTTKLNASAMLLICSTDGGKTWQARPGLAVVSTCSGASCPQSVTLDMIGALTITADGDLLADGPYGPVKNGIIQDVKTYLGFFRLKPGASQWDYLGAEPGNAYLYAPTPGAGTLWGYIGGTYGSTTLSGVIGGHIGPTVTYELLTASYVP